MAATDFFPDEAFTITSLALSVANSSITIGVEMSGATVESDSLTTFPTFSSSYTFVPFAIGGVIERIRQDEVALSLVASSVTSLNTAVDPGSIDTRFTSADTRFGAVDTTASLALDSLTSVGTSLTSVDTRFTSADTRIGAVATTASLALDSLTSVGTSLTSVDTRLGSADTRFGSVATSLTNVDSVATTVSELTSFLSGVAADGDPLVNKHRDFGMHVALSRQVQYLISAVDVFYQAGFVLDSDGNAVSLDSAESTLNYNFSQPDFTQTSTDASNGTMKQTFYSWVDLP